MRVADLGCLKGGYALEFSQLGFETTGIKVRNSNLAACNFVKPHTNQLNLTFIKGDAWDVGGHGPFGMVFCFELVYHIDRPKLFIDTMARTTKRVLIIQVHFLVDDFYARTRILRP